MSRLVIVRNYSEPLVLRVQPAAGTYYGQVCPLHAFRDGGFVVSRKPVVVQGLRNTFKGELKNGPPAHWK